MIALLFAWTRPVCHLSDCFAFQEMFNFCSRSVSASRLWQSSRYKTVTRSPLVVIHKYEFTPLDACDWLPHVALFDSLWCCRVFHNDIDGLKGLFSQHEFCCEAMDVDTVCSCSVRQKFIHIQQWCVIKKNKRFHSIYVSPTLKPNEVILGDETFLV